MVTVGITVLTLGFTFHGAWRLHQGVYRGPTLAPAPGVSCEAGITALHRDLEAVWAARREDPGAALDPALDARLRGLRARCEAEGPAGARAWAHLERWRYRAETQARMWHDLLAHDAQGARGYHSPPREFP
jgi:hypothetical protein